MRLQCYTPWWENDEGRVQSGVCADTKVPAAGWGESFPPYAAKRGGRGRLFRWLKSDFSAHNLNAMAADTNVPDGAAITIGADEELAGAFHFQALFNQHALVRRGNAVCSHPGGGASGG